MDVYSDWVDACDAVAKSTADRYEDGDSRGTQLRRSPASPDQLADSKDYGEAGDPYADDY